MRKLYKVASQLKKTATESLWEDSESGAVTAKDGPKEWNGPETEDLDDPETDPFAIVSFPPSDQGPATEMQPQGTTFSPSFIKKTHAILYIIKAYAGAPDKLSKFVLENKENIDQLLADLKDVNPEL